MTENFFKRNTSCTITGHRYLDKNFSMEKTRSYLEKLVEKGFDTFYVGMALGFDTVCFQILEKLRETNNIKIIACIPCKTQSAKFTYAQKDEYDRMIESADEKVLVSENYDSGCMQRRNQYMVDRSSVVLSYLNRDSGGTFNTVNYALKFNIPIINIGNY